MIENKKDPLLIIKFFTNTNTSPKIQMCQSIIDFLGHTSNKLPLDFKPIGHIPKTHLLKVSFDLLLAKRFG